MKNELVVDPATRGTAQGEATGSEGARKWGGRAGETGKCLLVSPRVPVAPELGNPEPGELGNWESYWLIEFGESLAMKLAVRCCRIQF